MYGITHVEWIVKNKITCVVSIVINEQTQPVYLPVFIFSLQPGFYFFLPFWNINLKKASKCIGWNTVVITKAIEGRWSIIQTNNSLECKKFQACFSFLLHYIRIKSTSLLIVQKLEYGLKKRRQFENYYWKTFKILSIEQSFFST